MLSAEKTQTKGVLGMIANRDWSVIIKNGHLKLPIGIKMPQLHDHQQRGNCLAKLWLVMALQSICNVIVSQDLTWHCSVAGWAKNMVK